MSQRRSSRLGLLTENEREYLRNGVSFSSKQRSKFLKLLLLRLEACTEDLNSIWKLRMTNPVITGWVVKNWNKLYSLSDSIDIRKQIPHNTLFTGRIKFRAIKNEGRKRAIRLYWLDKSAQTRIDYRILLSREHWLVGLRPPSLKEVFREALQLLNTPPYIPIIPTLEDNAVTVRQIRRKIREVKQDIQEQSLRH